MEDWLLSLLVDEPLGHATRVGSSTGSYITWDGSGDHSQPLVSPRRVKYFVSNVCDPRHAIELAEKLTIFDEQPCFCRRLRTLNTLWTGVYGRHVLDQQLPPAGIVPVIKTTIDEG